MSETTVIRQATFADAADLADMMGQAFHADPVSTWVFPDADQRRKLNAPFFRVFVDLALATGTILTTDDLSATTLWFGVDPYDTADDPAALLAEFSPFLEDEHLHRFATLDHLMSANHPHTEAHAYLAFAAVHPSRQGQGLGGALIRGYLTSLDASGVPAYLEASSPRNARLYEQLGFEHREPAIALPDGPSLLPMWRPGLSTGRGPVPAL